MAAEPIVTQILTTEGGGVEVLLEEGLKDYRVRIGRDGYTYEIYCEYPMETRVRRRSTTCRKQVKRSTPLFARLEAIAKVATIRSADAASS